MQATCTKCNGAKEIQCENCKGEKIQIVSCSSCQGNGSRNEKCIPCSGTGIEKCTDCSGIGKNADGKACLNCRGHGVIHCRNCAGTGNMNSGVCTTCNGEGKTTQQCSCIKGIQICDLCHGSGSIVDLEAIKKLEDQQQEQEWSKAQEEKEREEKRRKSIEEYDERQAKIAAKRRKYIIQVCVTLIVATLLIFYYYYRDKNNSGNHVPESTSSWLTNNNNDAINAAKSLLEKNLTSPSTTKYVSTKVVAQEPPYYLVHIAVDSQNSFGAMVRTSALVSVELVSNSDQYKYNALTSISDEVSDPPLALEIEMMKQLNKWPSTLTNPVSANDNASALSSTPGETNLHALDLFKNNFNNKMSSVDSSLMIGDYIQKIEPDDNRSSYLFKVTNHVEMLVSFNKGTLSAIMVNLTGADLSIEMTDTWATAIEIINPDVTYPYAKDEFTQNLKVDSSTDTDRVTESSFSSGNFLYSMQSDSKHQNVIVMNTSLVDNSNDNLPGLNNSTTVPLNENDAAAATSSDASQPKSETDDPYAWAPGVKEKFEKEMVDRQYVDSADSLRYTDPWLGGNGEGFYSVYGIKDGKEVYIVGVNVKTGWYHG